MEFIEMKAQAKVLDKRNLRRSCRISFGKPKSVNRFTLTVFIGKDICNKLGFERFNKLSLSYAKENENIWKIEKSLVSGQKLHDVSENTPEMRFQLRWRLSDPSVDNLGIRDVLVKEVGSDYIILDAS